MPDVHTYPGMQLDHGTTSCSGNFSLQQSGVLRCDECAAEYPADVHTLLSLAREHLAALGAHLAATRGRVALRNLRRGRPVSTPNAGKHSHSLLLADD
jgi:hypothetical protein